MLEKKGSIYESYDVLRVLGRGGFGEVSLVRCKTTGKCFALKVINKSCYIGDENLLNEIEVLKKLVIILRLVNRIIQILLDYMNSLKTQDSSI